MKEIIRIIGTTTVVLLVIAFVAYSGGNNSEYTDSDLNSSLDDALYGTNQTGDDKVTNILRDMMTLVRERNETDFKNSTELDKSDLYEVSSFETKEALIRTIALLKSTISELKSAEASVAKSYSQMEQLIRENAQLTESERVEAIKSFNERRNDVDSAAYRRERTETLIDVYEVTLEYYEFLYMSFEDYVIESNEYNERNIAFYTDENIDTANWYLAQIRQKSAVFEKAESTYSDYLNNRFAEDGLEMTTSELYNAL